MFNYAQAPVPPLSGVLLQDVSKRVLISKETSKRTPANLPVDDDK